MKEKKLYEKPSMQVYDLPRHPQLLQMSGNDPFNDGNDPFNP